MSNFLGVQIFTALPGATSDPLSSKCRKILGLSGRRLQEDDEDDPYNLNVQWGVESFISKIGQQTEMLENLKDDWNDLQSKLDGIALAVEDVQARLPTVLDPKDSGAEKSKKRPKAKKQKVEVAEEDRLFGRTLLDKEGTEGLQKILEEVLKKGELVGEIKGKVDSMESKVDLIETDIADMKGRMDTIEGKMDTIIEMIAQLLDQEELVEE